MFNFFKQFFYLLDKTDRRSFSLFVMLIFLSGILSLFGMGAVIPVMETLINPESIHSYSFLSHYSYAQLLVGFTALLVFAFWLKNAVSFFTLAIQSRYLTGLSCKIQKKLFLSYINMPYSAHLYRNTADLVRNLNNETSIFSTYIVNQFGAFLTELITSLLIFSVLLMVNFLFSLFVGGMLFFILILFSYYTRKRAKHYASLRAKAWSGLTKQVLQGLAGIKETKLYHKESSLLNDFNHNAEEMARASAFSVLFQQAPRFLVEASAITIVLGGLIYFILGLGYSSQKMVVMLSVFAVGAVQLLPSLNRLMQALSMIKYGRESLTIIYTEMNKLKSMVKNKELGSTPLQYPTFQEAIQLRHVTYTYPSGKQALSNITLSIEKNSKVAIVGESGAGKTTLVDLIMGFYSPQEGHIYLDGRLIESEKDYLEYQRLFGYIPQLIYLYDATICENVAFGESQQAIDREKVIRCLHVANLSALIEELPDGIDTLIGENGIRLSGGQRQRIGIARALYQEPSLLIMDEATAALDSYTEFEVTQALATVSQHHTVVTIAHRLSTIKYYDVIHVLDRGEIIASGSYSELLQVCEKFKHIVRASECSTI